MIRVIVYSSGDACMQCRMTERLMKAAGLVFERIDLTDPHNAADLIYVTRTLGYTSAPVVVVDGVQSWAGFQPDEIEAVARRVCGDGPGAS